MTEIVNATEAQLGGTRADPPGLSGRTDSGIRTWSKLAVERETAFALASRDSDDPLRPAAAWDGTDALPFPEQRRLIVKTPEMADRLPAPLGAGPGTRYLEGVVNSNRRGIDPTPVALDPGGGLPSWQDLDWVDRATGAAVRVTTDPADYRAVLLETLDDKATRWSRPSSTVSIRGVTVNPVQVRRLGRVSGVIDADADGLDDLTSRRPVYEEADRLAVVHAHAGRLGKRAFARLTGLPPTVAERAEAGEPISQRNVAKALRALRENATVRTCAAAGCARQVSRSDAVYCSGPCRERAKKRRARMRTRGR